ncbi:MAG: hypothetical protein J7K59_00665 [Candidatus Korarchaeota archaeon]|nr:hypothetical protein [Candidatus Korarchaeota archaeon]
MNKKQCLAYVLGYLSKRINERNIPWVLIGDLALWIHGLGTNPREIVIITSKSHVFKMDRFMKTFFDIIEVVGYVEEDNFIGYRGRYLVNGIPVEVYARPKLVLGKNILEVPFNLLYKCAIRKFMYGTKLIVAPIEWLIIPLLISIYNKCTEPSKLKFIKTLHINRKRLELFSQYMPPEIRSLINKIIEPNKETREEIKVQNIK